MNRVCEILGIKYPIIQGVMNWLTNAEFCAAVSNAGGLGMLGPNAGQTEVTPDPIETGERMRKEIRKVRTLTDKPFGVGLIGEMGNDFTEQILKVVIEEKVPVALVNTLGVEEDLFGNGMKTELGVPKELLKPLKDNGIKVIVRAWQPSVKDALRVEEQGADIYIATGFDEGGTLPRHVIGSFSIIPMIRDAVTMPLMLAGGVCDKRAVNAAFALGADGVYVGTRFLAANEAPVAQNVKEMIVHSSADELILYRVAPAYYRTLPVAVAGQLIENDANLTKAEAFMANAAVMGGGSGSGGMRLGMRDGDLEHGYVSVGTGISTIHSIRPVKEIVEDMMSDFVKGSISIG